MPRLPIKTQGKHNKSQLPPSILKKKAQQTSVTAAKKGSAAAKKRGGKSSKTGGARAKKKKSIFDQDSDVDGKGEEEFGKLGVLGIPKAIRAAMKKGSSG